MLGGGRGQTPTRDCEEGVQYRNEGDGGAREENKVMPENVISEHFNSNGA